MGKHILTKYQEKWKCPYCDKKYTDKNSHLICKVRQKQLQNKFIQSFLNNKDPITFIIKWFKKEYFNTRIEKGTFIYYPNLELGRGHCSKCSYGLEVTIKFALNHKALINYNKEGILINKLSDLYFYPKLYNFNNDNKKDYNDSNWSRFR